jgi:hypothetical protein
MVTPLKVVLLVIATFVLWGRSRTVSFVTKGGAATDQSSCRKTWPRSILTG